jgi:serine/threonine protein kinase
MSRSNGNGQMGPPPYSRQGPDGYYGNKMPVNEPDGYYGRGPGPGGSSGNRPYTNTNINQQQYGFDSRGQNPQSHQHVPPSQNQPLPAKIIPLTYFQKCIPQTRTIAHYKRIEQIGEGTYGQVYKAACLSSSRIVALKKIRLTSVATEGLPRTVIREIKILKALKHENMVQMLEVVTSKGCEYLDDEDEHKEDRKRRLKDEEQQQGKTGGSSEQHQQSSSKSNNKELTNENTEREKYKGNLFLVLEYISHDLSGILDMGVRFTPVQSKCIFRQLLSVLQYMHEKRYVHRDLKSSNILVDERYRVKLADFGLARSLDDE